MYLNLLKKYLLVFLALTIFYILVIYYLLSYETKTEDKQILYTEITIDINDREFDMFILNKLKYEVIFRHYYTILTDLGLGIDPFQNNIFNSSHIKLKEDYIIKGLTDDSITKIIESHCFKYKLKLDALKAIIECDSFDLSNLKEFILSLKSAHSKYIENIINHETDLIFAEYKILNDYASDIFEKKGEEIKEEKGKIVTSDNVSLSNDNYNYKLYKEVKQKIDKLKMVPINEVINRIDFLDISFSDPMTLELSKDSFLKRIFVSIIIYLILISSVYLFILSLNNKKIGDRNL